MLRVDQYCIFCVKKRKKYCFWQRTQNKSEEKICVLPLFYSLYLCGINDFTTEQRYIFSVIKKAVPENKN